MKAEEVTTHARKGAAWSLIIAGIAFPLTFFGRVLLGRADPTGEVSGTFAFLLQFLNAIYTFLYPGGRNIFPAYLPKMRDVEERSRFASGLLYLVLVSTAIGLVVTTVWPELVELVLQKPVDGRTRFLLQCLIPFALISSLANSIVIGNMSFVWASILPRVQLVCVAIVGGIMWLSGSSSMVRNAAFWLSMAILFAAVLDAIASCVLLSKNMRLRWRPMFPAGCFRFLSLTYLDTVLVWAYLAMDKYFIRIWFGMGAVGVYAAALDAARIIPMAVQQLGQLLLTTFSKLLGDDNEEALQSAYRRVTRLTAAFNAMVSTAMIFFSHQMMSLFGTTFAEHHLYLVGLAVVMNLDSLRTVNSMTLMAYERMGSVLRSKLLQSSVEFCVTYALIPRIGIFGVIVGKGAGHIVSSVSLFIAIAKVTKSKKLLLPKGLYSSQLIVLTAAAAAFAFDNRSIIAAFAGVLVSWAAIAYMGGFRKDDLRVLIPWRRGRGAAK